jgi:hypothetical protein
MSGNGNECKPLAAGPTLDDCSCTADFTILSAIAASCIPKDVPQTEKCCTTYMKVVQEHPVRSTQFCRLPQMAVNASQI